MARLTAKSDDGKNYYYLKCHEECDGNPAGWECEKCDHDAMVCDKLGYYEDLEERGLLIKVPVGMAIGGPIYEVIEEDVPTHHYYIQIYEVQDISVLGIKYGDEWISREKMEEYNVCLTREAVEKLKKELETKEKELKRCPFCGGEVEVEDIEPGEDDHYYMIQCKNKECDAAVCFGEKDKEQFIKAWNRRVEK